MNKIKRILIILFVLLSLIMIVTGIMIVTNTNAFQFDLILPYSYIGNITDSYIPVSDGENFGYIDKNGDIILPIEYPILDSMKNEDGSLNLDKLQVKEDLMLYTDDTMLFGVVDIDQNIIIPARYNDLTIINKDLFLVYDLTSYYFINASLERVFENGFSLVQPYSDLEDVFLVTMDDGFYNLFTSDGSLLLDQSYQQINKIYDSSSNTHLFIATNGNYIDYYLYQDNKLLKLDSLTNMQLQEFTGGTIILINNNGNYISYSIDEEKQVVYQEEYISLSAFSNGLSLVVNNDGLAGYIDSEEQLVIPYQYDYYNTFSFTDYDLAVASKNNLVGVINKEGEEILSFEYTYIEIINKNRFIVIDQDNNANIIDENENILTSTSYQSIISTALPNLFIVSKEENDTIYYGLIDDNGNKIIELQYLNIMVEDHYILVQSDTEYLIKWL